MPSTRRAVLGAAVGTATVAGCVTSRLPAVEKRSDPTPPEEATRVAAATERRDPDRPYGTFDLSAAAYRVGTGEDERLFLYSDYQLVPGRNQDAGDGWLLDELRIEHEYTTALRPVETATSFVPSEDGSPAARLGRTESAASDGLHRWRLQFVNGGDNTWTARFAAVAAPLVDTDGVGRFLTVRARVRETPRSGFDGHETTLTTVLRDDSS